MASFQLDIVTPEKTVYSGEIEHFQAPGVDGSFGVLARHQPLLAALGIGRVGSPRSRRYRAHTRHQRRIRQCVK